MYDQILSTEIKWNVWQLVKSILKSLKLGMRGLKTIWNCSQLEENKKTNSYDSLLRNSFVVPRIQGPFIGEQNVKLSLTSIMHEIVTLNIESETLKETPILKVVYFGCYRDTRQSHIRFQPIASCEYFLIIIPQLKIFPPIFVIIFKAYT